MPTRHPRAADLTAHERLMVSTGLFHLPRPMAPSPPKIRTKPKEQPTTYVEGSPCAPLKSERSMGTIRPDAREEPKRVTVETRWDGREDNDSDAGGQAPTTASTTALSNQFRNVPLLTALEMSPF
jgi:hypothetical protein